ncbi:MAG: DMT family transporter [Carbonactinosporaceae bacterium]
MDRLVSATGKALRHESPLLLAVVFLGTNPVAVKYAVRTVPPLPFVTLRFTAAGLLLLALLLLLRRTGGRPDWRDLTRMAAVGALGVGLNNALFTTGVDMTAASDTALIYSAVPVWGMLLGAALGWERPTARNVAGVVLALAGVVLIVRGDLGGGDGSLGGDLLVAGATFCWASYAVFSLPLLRSYPPLLVAAYTMIFGGLAVLPAALPGFARTDWPAVGPGTWAAFAYCTLCVAAFGFSAWQTSISRVGANRVLVYQYLITFVGVTAGTVMLGEGLAGGELVGGGVLLCGVYLARRPPAGTDLR